MLSFITKSYVWLYFCWTLYIGIKFQCIMFYNYDFLVLGCCYSYRIFDIKNCFSKIIKSLVFLLYSFYL